MKSCHYLPAALLIGSTAAPGMTITGYSSAANDRFSSGYPLAPVENADPAYVGAGLDWSGVAWASSVPTKSFGLISPQHYLVARHFGGASVLRLFAEGGVHSFTQNKVENTGFGLVFSGQTVGDLSLGTLNQAVPASLGVPRYGVLDLNATSAANTPDNYLGTPLLLYGRGPDGASSTRVGAASINGYFLDGNNQFITTSRDAVQLEGGDSGSPAFHRWTNPNGRQELAILGNHAGISVEDNVNGINFLGTIQMMGQLNAFMNDDGYALRVVGNPTNTWVGSTSTNITNRAAWGLFAPASAPSDTFVTFDAATAGSGRVVTVDADHNLRGLYFRSTAATTNGFAIGGGSALTLGRGGIANYDNSRQTFTAAISLGAPQYWDGGSGGITVGDIATNGRLLEITGSGVNEIDGTITGSGGIAVSGGLLEITGANSYSGRTWVHAGELAVNNLTGSATGSGSVTVAAGATLSGNGTIQGSTTLSGTLSPGNSIGTLTVGNDTVWNGGDAWQFELGSPAVSLESASLGGSIQDLLLITNGGDFLKGSGTSWTFDFANSGAIGWFRLIDWDGATTFDSGDFTAANLAPGTSGEFLIDGATTALYLRVIPEPATAALSALGLCLLLRRRR
jgi:autotransporter-associated beta strand protein